jgi:hypothetical protein
MGNDPDLDPESQITGKALTDLLGAAITRWVGP